MTTTSLQQQTADYLLLPSWVLPMNRRGIAHEGYAVVISGNRIAAVGPAEELLAQFKASNVIDLQGHIVLPGLINAHGHCSMSLLRGFADDLPLQRWLHEKIWPAESNWVSEEFVRDGAELAIAEMLLSGTTCFADMYFFPEQVAEAAAASGIRARLNTPVLDFPTVWARDADEYIDKGTKLNDSYRLHERISMAFGPHAPYTVADSALQKIAMYAEEMQVGIHMHMHENATEISEAMAASGMRPLTRLKQLGLLGPQFQAVHMTQLLAEETALLAELNVPVIHCPASNMKLASGVCPVPQLLAAGVCVALGTDGCASNNNLDMFNEMRMAAMLGKISSGDATALPAWQILEMATCNGARALGMEQDTGTVEAGKLADLIAVNMNMINSQPLYDPASALVYSACSTQVSHVWVHGQLLVENRLLKHMPLPDILQNAKAWQQRIQELAVP